MRRAELASELALPLAERIDEYLALDELIAERRLVDRSALAAGLFQLLPAWGGLAARADEGEVAGRLMAAALMGGPVPGFPWYAIQEGHLEREAQEAIASAKRSIQQLDPISFRESSPSPPEDLPERLRILSAHLRAGTAGASESEALARDLQHHQALLGVRAADEGMGVEPVGLLRSLVSALILGVPPIDVQDETFPLLAGGALDALARQVGKGDPVSRSVRDPVLF
ncbi:MAG: hypothetical protein ACRDL8_22335, partial [Solirubrobacteraceae bacterium]